MSQYNYDTNSRVFTKNYLGEVTLESITSSWNKLIEENRIPKETVGFILDYRKANFNMPLHKLKGISEYYRAHLDVFGGKRVAIVTESSKDIIVPVIVLKEDSGYESKPFSTIKAAQFWVTDL